MIKIRFHWFVYVFWTAWKHAYFNLFFCPDSPENFHWSMCTSLDQYATSVSTTWSFELNSYDFLINWFVLIHFSFQEILFLKMFRTLKQSMLYIFQQSVKYLVELHKFQVLSPSHKNNTNYFPVCDSFYNTCKATFTMFATLVSILCFIISYFITLSLRYGKAIRCFALYGNFHNIHRSSWSCFLRLIITSLILPVPILEKQYLLSCCIRQLPQHLKICLQSAFNSF